MKCNWRHKKWFREIYGSLVNPRITFFQESERPGLRLNIKKNAKSIAFGPITARQIEGEKEVVTDSSSLAEKSLGAVTTAMKSEDDCFLAEKQ